MSETAQAPPAAARRPRGLKPPAIPDWAEKAFIPIFFALAIILPFILDPNGGLMFDMTAALAYVVMALGLNIIVGFAGLLDLGYVAFYAFGAYAMGWFASSWFAKENVHLLVQGPLHALPGIHMNFLIVCLIAMIMASLAGVIIGFIQQISDNRIGSEWTPAIVFVYLILIMVFKPSGLLGEETREAG